jgi:DNA-directed RNA polymerase subunit F
LPSPSPYLFPFSCSKDYSKLGILQLGHAFAAIDEGKKSMAQAEEQAKHQEVQIQYRTYIKDYAEQVKKLKDENAEQVVAEAIKIRKIIDMEDCM